MVNTVPFDTLAYAKKLEQHGVIAEQAEAHANALAEVLEGNFVTKNDSKFEATEILQKIDSLRGETNTKIDAVRSEINILRGEMNTNQAKVEGKFNLLYWMIGFLLTINVAVAIKLLFS